jgi:hypothetical protein
LLDIFWRFVWVVLALVITVIGGSAAMSEWGTLVAPGPDLGAANPIIVLAALRQFWDKYGALLLVTAGILALTLLLLWIVLEALFRGGWKGFWTYLGTGLARVLLLFGTLGIFAQLSTQDASGGTLVIGITAITAMWFLIGGLESVVRRNAVDLLATDLHRLWAVVGLLRFIEGALAFLLLGSAAAAWMRASDKALVGIWFSMVFFFWMLIQSYLVAVRYSAIDIMRRDAVGS